MERTRAHPPVRPASGRRRAGVYLAVGVAVLVLAVIAFVVHERTEPTREAEDKADQLIAAFEDAGLDPPDKDRAVRLFGTDGGAMCADPGDALNQAIANQVASSGAAGPGQRPGLIARELIEAETVAIGVYCPGELPAFMDFVDGLDLADLTAD